VANHCCVDSRIGRSEASGRARRSASSRFGCAARALLAALALVAFAWPEDAAASDFVGPFHLAVGGGASDQGAVGIADLGCWLGPFLPTFSYRSTIHADRGSASFKGGRLDIGLWPVKWMAIHAGGGGGVLVNEGSGGSVNRAALVAGATITFGSRDLFNYFGFGVELMLPLGTSPVESIQPAPLVMATITVQPLFFYALYALK
jgi:hypothetical protein